LSIKDERERDYRRAEVLKLDVEGLSEREIASKLMISNGTVHNDLVYLRKKAKDNILLYVDDKLPSEYEKCLTGINSILKEAWNTSRSGDKREKMQALSLAKECYSMKLDLLTNVGVIREAMRFITDKKRGEDNAATDKKEPSRLLKTTSNTKEDIDNNEEPETINKVF